MTCISICDPIIAPVPVDHNEDFFFVQQIKLHSSSQANSQDLINSIKRDTKRLSEP